MIPPLLFRRAEAQDAALLTEIALAAKQHWGYPDEWMAEWRHDLAVTPGYIRSQPVQVAELEGEVVGFAGLSMLEGNRYLEHLWLRPKHIGRGFGRALFLEAVRQAREANAPKFPWCAVTLSAKFPSFCGGGNLANYSDGIDHG